MTEFKKRNIEVIGISIDSQFTHHAWRKTKINEGGIGPVKFTLVADINHRITKSYGVEHPDAGVAFRGAFMIDKKVWCVRKSSMICRSAVMQMKSSEFLMPLIFVKHMAKSVRQTGNLATRA